MKIQNKTEKKERAANQLRLLFSYTHSEKVFYFKILFE